MVFEDRILKNPKLFRLKDPRTNEIVDFEIQDLSADEILQEGTEINADILNKLFTKNVTETGTDLNDYTEDGKYYFSQTYKPTNIPGGCVNGFLQVISSGTIYKQIWYRHGTNNTNDFETYVRICQTNGGWSDWQQFAMVNKIGGSTKLWSGTCNVGDTITLSESIKNFRFVLIKPSTDATYLMCPIISSSTAVRGTNSYAKTDSIQIISVRGTCSSTSFTLDALSSMTVATSGTTTNNYQYITEIWGVR